MSTAESDDSASTEHRISTEEQILRDSAEADTAAYATRHMFDVAMRTTFLLGREVSAHASTKEKLDNTTHELAETKAKLAAAEAEGDRLRAERAFDPKTGWRSERALNGQYDRLDRAIAASRLGEQRAYPLRFSCLFLDFDGFGSVNTYAGHPMGDVLLSMLGERMSNAVRDSLRDEIYRMGGDEAVIILHHYELTPSDHEFLRARIDEAGKAAFEEFLDVLELENPNAAQTLRRMALYGYSVGIASYDPLRHLTARAVSAEANAGMHNEKAKRKMAAGFSADTKITIRDGI